MSDYNYHYNEIFVPKGKCFICEVAEAGTDVTSFGVVGEDDSVTLRIYTGDSVFQGHALHMSTRTAKIVTCHLLRALGVNPLDAFGEDIQEFEPGYNPENDHQAAIDTYVEGQVKGE